MNVWVDWKTIFVLGPIFGLLLLGFVITLRSGVANFSTEKGHQTFMGNLSQLLLRVAGYVVGLVALQRFLGAPF